jgi:hypothetical protein
MRMSVITNSQSIVSLVMQAIDHINTGIISKYGCDKGRSESTVDPVYVAPTSSSIDSLLGGPNTF